MTLSIASTTSSGIVLTADSRQTYINKAGMTRIGTDNAVKLFQLNEKIGAVIAGRAFFLDTKLDPKGVLKNTGWFIEEFAKNISKKDASSVKETAQKLNDYLIERLIKPEEPRVREFIKSKVEADNGKEITFCPLDKLKLTYSFKDVEGKKITKDYYMEPVSLIVAGYDNDGVGRAYLTEVPDGPTIERTTEIGGPLWIGQTEVIVRIIKGFGWEIRNLGFVKDAISKGIKVDDDLNKLEYIINWGTMTMQDALDFNVLMTKITENIQRFSDGTIMNPGGITGVGGYVNVAVITSKEGFRWINKKDLVIDND